MVQMTHIDDDYNIQRNPSRNYNEHRQKQRS